MFGRFFKQPSPVQKVEQPRGGIHFIEPIQGPGLDSLRLELATRLLKSRNIENAYLPKLQYAGEEVIRNCLVLVESEPLTAGQKEAIAAQCSGITPLDIHFAQDLPSMPLSAVLSNRNPLYLQGLSLYECPLIVRNGSNPDMPPEWPCAMSFWWVTAKTPEEALRHAVGAAKEAGFVFVDLHEGKVSQFDPKYWSELVLKHWRDYSEHLPTQEQIEAAAVTGGIFKGPNLGPLSAENEPPTQ